MKLLKKTTALLIVALVFFTMLPTAYAADNDNGVVFTEVQETVYATGTVNIRTGPSTSFKKIGVLIYGHAIQRIGIGENGWSKVLYNGGTAYIFSEYLSTTRPVVTAPEVDYAKLIREIAMANGLRRLDYTKESWGVLTDALTQATSALNSDKQATVDNCEKALKEAIAALKKVDRSALENALSECDDFISTDSQHELWVNLVTSMHNGETVLADNDQAAIDAAVVQINAALAEVQALVQAQATPEIVVQEVQVEVPPTDDYCNIPSHRVWPVVFFCSLALNVALVVVIVVYVYRKKKNQKDDTPLVDYDISDDLF